MLFYALKTAALENENPEEAQRCVERIQSVGSQMPDSISSQLMQFQLDYTIQGSKERIDSLLKTKNAMKQALDLP